jgi:hypothetical protein
MHLWDEDVKVFAGAASLCQIVEMHEIDLVLNRDGWFLQD